MQSYTKNDIIQSLLDSGVSLTSSQKRQKKDILHKLLLETRNEKLQSIYDQLEKLNKEELRTVTNKIQEMLNSTIIVGYSATYLYASAAKLPGVTSKAVTVDEINVLEKNSFSTVAEVASTLTKICKTQQDSKYTISKDRNSLNVPGAFLLQNLLSSTIKFGFAYMPIVFIREYMFQGKKYKINWSVGLSTMLNEQGLDIEYIFDIGGFSEDDREKRVCTVKVMNKYGGEVASHKNLIIGKNGGELLKQIEEFGYPLEKCASGHTGNWRGQKAYDEEYTKIVLDKLKTKLAETTTVTEEQERKWDYLAVQSAVSRLFTKKYIPIALGSGSKSTQTGIMINDQYIGGTVPVGVHVRSGISPEQLDSRFKEIKTIGKVFQKISKIL